MSAHEELLERLRKADSGSFALECEIHRIVTGNDNVIVPPPYTVSIEAALRLVPEGLYWFLGYGRVRADEPLGACGLVKPGSGDPFITEQANTVALAICVAALSARSLTTPEREAHP